MDNRLQDFIDKSEIRDLLARYYIGVDARDWAAIESCFTQDVHAEFHAFTADGLPELMRNISGVARTKVSTHFMGNHLAAVKGDTATCETYCEIHMIYAEPRGDRADVFGARYLDQLVRLNGQWKVKHRIQHRDWGREEFPTPQPARLIPNPSVQR